MAGRDGFDAKPQNEGLEPVVLEGCERSYGLVAVEESLANMRRRRVPVPEEGGEVDGGARDIAHAVVPGQLVEVQDGRDPGVGGEAGPAE